ncbi:PQQ-binding-like beta-propeller repeat protein [bacterium]|nr:PQQ-binding-like beta-propeller repeat protein [bacterium]
MRKSLLFAILTFLLGSFLWAQPHVDLIVDGNGDNVYGALGSGAGGQASEEAGPGATLWFTITLQNEDPMGDRFTLSWNAPTGWTVTLNGNNSPFLTDPILPNGSATYILEVQIPLTAGQGSQTIILDANSQRLPNSKVDSVRIDVTVAPHVDLIIAGNGDNIYGALGTGGGGSATRMIAQGDRISLPLTLQNEDSIADAFRLSWNTPPGWEITVEGNNSGWTTPQISAGGQANYNIQVVVPSDAQAGNYEVILDCQSLTNSSKVDSVKISLQLTVIQTDLLIDGQGEDIYDPSGGGAGGSSQKDGSPGTYIPFAITLQNESSFDASFQLSLSAFPPAGWEVYINDGTDHQLYPPAQTWTTPKIPANGSANYTLRVFIPANATAGTYNLKLIAHSIDPVNDTQHGDSVTATVNVITAKCDLLIEGQGEDVYGAIGSGAGGEATKTSAAGTAIQFAITLQNEDSEPDSYQISWNTPSGWTVSLDGNSSPFTTPQIAGNASVTYSLQVTIPANAIGGTTSIIVDVQSQRLPDIKFDSVKANVVVPRADSIIEGNGDNVYGALGSGAGGSVSKLTDPGTTANFAITLQNEDTVDDTFQFSLASAPAGWAITLNDGTASHSLPWTTSTITSGGSANYTLEVAVPAGAPTGVYDIILDVQSTDANKNYKVDSVKATVLVTGVAHADLIIDGNGDDLYGTLNTGAGGTSQKRGEPGTTVQFQVTLQNEDIPQFPGMFDWFQFTCLAPSGWQVTLNGNNLPWTPPPIPRGGQNSFTLQVQIPEGVTSGTYKVILNAQSTANSTKVDSVTAKISIINPADVWPMFHYEKMRTGRSKYEGSPTAELKWASQTGGQVNSSPAIRRQQIEQTDAQTGETSTAWVDVIYVGSNDGYIYSYDWNGNLRWRWIADANNPSPIISSPAVDDQGNVYFGDSNGNFYCLKDNYTPMAPNPPTLSWSHNIGAGIRLSSPVIANGMVLVSADNGNVYAFYADGTLAWQYSTGATVPADVEIPPSPAAAPDGTILIGDGAGRLHAINPDGTPKWQFATIGSTSTPPIPITSTPAVFWPSILNPSILPDPNTYFIYITSRDGNLYELNPDGTENWHYTIGSPINSSPAVWYPHYTPFKPAPSPDQRIIIVGADNGNLYAVKINPMVSPHQPALAWQATTTQDKAIVSSPAIGANGYVYVGSKDNKVYAFNVQTGAQQWVFSAPQNEVISSPAIGSDMTVYVGSKDQYLYAILTTGGGYAPLIEKYADRTQVAPNGTITYTIVIGNQGSIPLYDLWVYDPLDPHTTYVGATPLPVSTAGNAVLWYLPVLEPGQFLYLTLTVRVNPGTQIGTWIYNTAYLWDISSEETAVQVVMWPISPTLYITDQNYNPLPTTTSTAYLVDGSTENIAIVNNRYGWGDRVFLKLIYLPPDTTNVQFFLQNSLPGGYFNAVHQLVIEDDPDHPGYKRATGHLHLRPRDNMPTAPPFFPYGTPLGGEGTGWRLRREFVWSATARITGPGGTTAQQTVVYSQTAGGQRSFFIVNNPISVEILGITPPNNSEIDAGNGNWVYNTQNPDMSNPNHWIPAFFCDFGDVQHNQASAHITVRIHNNSSIELHHIRVESPDIKRMNGNIAIIPHSLPDETDADYPDIPRSRVRAVTADGVDLTQQDINIPANGYTDVDIYVQVPIYQPPADGYVWDPTTGQWVPNPNPPLGYRTWNRNHQENANLIDRTFMLRIFWDNYRGPRQSGICSFSSPYWGAPDVWDPASGKPVNFQEEAYRNLILRVVVPPTPSLTVDESVIDFGKLPHGTFPTALTPLPSKTFTVRNTGNINLLYLRADREHLLSDGTDPSIFLSRTLVLTNIDFGQFPAIYGTASNPGMIRKAPPDSSQPTSAVFNTWFAFIPTAQPVGVYSSTLHIYEDLNNDLVLQRDPSTGQAVEPEATSNPVLKVEVREAPLSLHKPDLAGQTIQSPAIARFTTQTGYGDVYLAFSHYDIPAENTWSLWMTRLFATPFANAVPSVPPTEWPDIHIYDDIANNRPAWDTAPSTVIASSTNPALFPPLGNPSGDPSTDPPLYIKHTEPSWFSDATGLHLFWRGWAFRQNSQVWDGRIFYSPDGSTALQIGADASYKNSPRLTIIPANYTPTNTPWALLLWFSGGQGSWKIFYNSNPINPTDLTAWQADRQVPLPSEVSYAKDPFPLWRIMNINGQPTPVLELIYAGFLSTRGSMKILMSRYPFVYDSNTGRLTLSGQLLAFPRVIGEVLQRNESGTIYWSKHIYWMTRRDDPALAPRIWADNREITGWRWDPDKQQWFVDDPQLGKIWMDTISGTITFQQPFTGNVTAEYSPRVLCLTSSTLTDAQPIAVVESSLNTLHPPVGQPGWQGQPDPRSAKTYLNRDRIHLFWRRSHSPLAQGQVTLFYKALRVRALSLLPPSGAYGSTAFMDAKGTIWVKVTGGAYEWYPMDPLTGIIYFAPEDEGKTIILNFNNQQVVPGLDEETVLNPEKMVPIDNITNESQLSAFANYLPGPYMDKIWLAWTTPKALLISIYYETYSPSFWR